MATIERHNQVQYWLDSYELGLRRVQPPKSWDTDKIEIKRDKDSKGFTLKNTIGLEFYGEASEYIMQAYRSFGVQAKVRLIKYEKDKTDEHERFKVSYIQELDLGTVKYNQRNGKLTVKAIEGGLFSEIKDRQSEEYDLIDKYSADADFIGDLPTYNFQPQPRGVYQESKLEGSAEDFRLNSGRWDSNAADAYVGVPMNIVYQSYEGEQNVFDGSNGTSHSLNNTIGTQQRPNDQFFLNAPRDLTLTLKFHLDFTITHVDKDDSSQEEYQVQFRVSDNGDNIELKSIETILDLNDPGNDVGDRKVINFEKTIDVKQGESMSFVFYSFGYYDGGALGGKDNRMDVYHRIHKSQLIIENKTPYPATYSRCITYKDFLNRIAAKITGRNDLIQSEVLETGEYKDLVIDNGFWARGFPDITIDEATKEERRTQLKASWKKAFKALEYIEPMTWYVDTDGNKEVIKIDTADVTMQNFIGIDLGVVDKLEFNGSPNDFYKSASVGMEQDLEYEEINGLDEYNGLSQFGTPVSRGKTDYDAKCPYNIDATGYELTRRKQYENYPTEDTNRDENIWLHWGKRISNTTFTHKLWQDDFDEAPKGIFDPNTAWNLWLSPMNRLFYGHGYSINRGLYHNGNKKIRLNSSNANSNLITKKNGKKLRESGEILVSDLPLPYIEPEKMMIEVKLTESILTQLKGKTNGYPNYFGLVKATYRGSTYYGRLISVKTDDNTKVELINAYINEN